MVKLLKFLVVLTAATNPSIASEPIVLNIPIHPTVNLLKLYKQVARDYEAAKGGAVVVQLDGDPRVNERVQVRLLEGSPPVIVDSVNNLWALIEGGRILQLDEFLDGPNWEGNGRWRDSFLTGSLDRYTINGKTYGIPLLYIIHTFWYDKNLFEKQSGQVLKTWDELYALCDQIKGAGISPIPFQRQYPYACQRLIDSAYYHLAGNDRLNGQKGLAPSEHDNPQLVEALQLMMVYIANGLPFGIIVLTGFFRSLPASLYEAALIDGAAEWRAYWGVMLPVARPSLITVAIFTFLGTWNKYFIAFMFLSGKDSDALQTLPLGMANVTIASQYQSLWGIAFGGLVLVLLPVLITYILLQRYLVTGVTTGAIKA